MNRAEKAQIIEHLKEKADRASICVVTDFKGMGVDEMTGLRAKLREVGVDYAVVKNTLARIAVAEGQHVVLQEHLKDNNAIAFGYEDPVAATKVLADFAKDSKKFQLKYGSLEGSFLEEEQLKALAKMPSKPEMLGKLLGTMNAVPTNFVSLLANVPRGLLNVLTAVKDQKAEAA